MRKSTFFLLSLLAAVLSANTAFAADEIAPQGSGNNWHQPAGPNGNWQVDGSAPIEWSVTRKENILWSTPLPEAGMSGVTVAGRSDGELLALFESPYWLERLEHDNPDLTLERLIAEG